MPGNEQRRPRIAIAGFQHETNCFGVSKAGLPEFEMADSWPAMLHGAEVVSQTKGMNLPIAGFAEAALETGVDLVPILWCAAEPSAQVTDHAFEAISGMILDGLRQAGTLEGIYLDLHGAMVTESHDDGEGELLRRVRELVGPDLPIVISLDLHANVSPEIVDRSSYITIFRTYPHLDMAESGARCLSGLRQLLDGNILFKKFRQISYLIPLHAQYTGTSPCKDLYDLLPNLERSGVQADIALGFTAADLPNTRPSCVAYGNTEDAAVSAVDRIAVLFDQVEKHVDHAMYALSDIKALIRNGSVDKPVILADVQDNPGAGATSDTTGLLNALVDCGAQRVLMGLFHDPEVAAAAHAHRRGSVLRISIGGKSGLPGQTPFEADFEVIALSDGVCRYSGEMYGGGIATLGETAALRLVGSEADIDVVVTSIRTQCLDLAHFTHLGLQPSNYKVICVKSTVHFRAAFEDISSAVYSISSPGAFPCDLSAIPYQNLHQEIRPAPIGSREISGYLDKEDA
ncbi:M81 family metallopeptidase [Roseibium sp. SCP14]|uniref:M81 family metallopeptidase n=1 Tax=Roseibium sp. SCP14 TaxID=3141375 RepID=UPI003335C2A7